MRIATFDLERYFSLHEFSAPHLLSCSDCEPMNMAELVALADDETGRMWQELKLSYTETMGHPLLREAVASTYSHLGAQDVIEVVPEEGIFLAIHATLREGDHVVATVPAYQSLVEVARSIGCEVTPWAPREESSWRFDVADLEALLRPETRLVVTNFPHNPTGAVPSAEEFRALVELLRGREIRLFSDEMYRTLEVAPAATLPAAADLYDGAVSLSGLSKSLGLPGLRVGWLATRDEALLQRVSELKDYTTICAAAPSEVLAIIALRNRQAILAGHRERIKDNLELLGCFFDAHRETFDPRPPRGGSVCFPRLRQGGAAAFCEEMIETAGIMIVPSSAFHFGDDHVRIGLGRASFPAVLERLGEALS